MRKLVVTFAALALPAMLEAQESVRDLDRPGKHHKHLTRDTVDRWKVAAEAGEVLRVHVTSGDFDPVLEFVTADGEVIQDEVDDPGSASRFLLRVEEAGKYEILVHGPDKRGGGNYRLHVERFFSKPIGADRALQSTLDRDGVDHVVLEAREGEVLVPVGAPIAEFMDPKGESMADWHGSYTVTGSGKHYVRLRGPRGQPYELRVIAARQRELDASDVTNGVQRTEELGERGMDVFEFAGRVGDFRLLELEHRRPCRLRVVYLDQGGTDDQLRRRPEFQQVPVHSKGNRQRHAFVLGREGRFQIQILSAVAEPNGYDLSFGDPSQPTPIGDSLEGTLAIGGSAFYIFDAEPGQLLRIDTASDRFDPLMSVKRADGTDLAFDDDGGTDLSSRHTFLVTEPGPYRIHVACYGNGGGGSYSLRVQELEVPVIGIGETREHAIDGPGASYWHFQGRKDQTVFVSVRSATMDMAVQVFDPRGIDLGSDDESGVGHDALQALRLPMDGRYTLVSHNKSGSGSCRIQLLDPDA